MADEDALEVLGFAGSMRFGSFNRALLAAAIEAAPDGMVVTPYSLADIPLYNHDLEVQGDPEPVRVFKEVIAAADGVLISTPEYNHGVAGVTKNAIDWASRPARRSALKGKPVAVMGASGGRWGTVRAQAQLRQAFTFTDSYAMPQPEVLVPNAGEKFDDDGRLIDEYTRETLRHFLEAFARWIRLFRDGGSGAAANRS